MTNPFEAAQAQIFSLDTYTLFGAETVSYLKHEGATISITAFVYSRENNNFEGEDGAYLSGRNTVVCSKPALDALLGRKPEPEKDKISFDGKTNIVSEISTIGKSYSLYCEGETKVDSVVEGQRRR